MYENLIRNYVSKMTINDIKKYASIKNINATEEEMQIVYEFIKKYYSKFNKNDMFFIEKYLKPKIRPQLYNQLLILYNEAKAKYL